MKTMTCKQLGGVCDAEFQAATFEEMAMLSQQHGTEMYQRADPEHVKVMQEMLGKMKDPKAMQEWMNQKRAEFEALPENK